MTLAELLIALAIVPGLLLASSVIYIHIARSLQETTDRGQAITQREHIVNFLDRYIANGTDAIIPLTAATDPTVGCLGDPDCEWAYILTVTMPDASGWTIYRLRKNNGTGKFPILESCITTVIDVCNGTWEQATYSGTSDFRADGNIRINAGWIDRQVDFANDPPFKWDPATKTVTVKLLFHSSEKLNGQSYAMPVKFDVKLRGGGASA